MFLILINIRNTGDGERIFLSELETDPIDEKIPKKIAINQGRNKLILNNEYNARNAAYFSYPPPEIEKIEIYDHAADPHERNNIVLSDPDLTRKLLDFFKIHFIKKSDWSSVKAINKAEIREQLRALGYIK